MNLIIIRVCNEVSSLEFRTPIVFSGYFSGAGRMSGRRRLEDLFEVKAGQGQITFNHHAD